MSGANPGRDDDIRNRGQGWCDRRTGAPGIRLDVLTDKRLPANGAGPSAERELRAQRSGAVAGGDQARVWRREGESFPSELRGQQVDRRKPGQNEAAGRWRPHLGKAAPCDSEFEGASRGRGRHAVDGTLGSHLGRGALLLGRFRCASLPGRMPRRWLPNRFAIFWR